MLDTGTTLTPHLCCRNAQEAVEFYIQAFGAESRGQHSMPDGRLMHAELSIDGAVFYLVDEFPEQGGLSPHALGGTPVTLFLRVPDCESAFARAVQAGCEVRMPLEDMFWGERWGLLSDPYGHLWSISTPIREVSEQEIEQALAQMSASPTPGA